MQYLFSRRSRAWATLVACLALGATAAPTAFAQTQISPASLGVNFSGSPSNLAAASAAGVGLARESFVVINSNTDAAFELTAAAHLRMYAALGLPQSNGPSADAAAMAAFVTSFAQRYGPGGSFWAAHTGLPYLPVQSYEIGNEPNTPPTEPGDGSWLRYGSPAGYAEVYEAARTALHAVDPSGTVVVGGMLDSGDLPLATVESYLSAIGPMDAVGFHPYLYDLTLMEQDTLALRQWLDSHGHTGVPLDVNEFGATDGLVQGIATWGPEVAAYTQWALCTPGLEVEDVQPFIWGAIPSSDEFPWYPMFTSDQSETPLGSAYLAETNTLTSQGCPAPPAPAPNPAPANTTNPASNNKTPTNITKPASNSKTPTTTTKPASINKTPTKTSKTTKPASKCKTPVKTRKTRDSGKHARKNARDARARSERARHPRPTTTLEA